MDELTRVSDLPAHVGSTVRIGGWVTHLRSKGKIAFAVVRDGTGVVQCVAFRGKTPNQVFEQTAALAVETSVIVTGDVREDARSPGGVELGVVEGHLNTHLRGKRTDSVNRWIIHDIEKIPKTGERFEIDGLTVEIQQSSGRHIHNVKILFPQKMEQA